MILHLTNDYSGSTVYKNLIGQLDQLGFEQIVYNPVRDLKRINKNRINFNVKDSKIIYSPVLNNFTDRLFYQSKIRKLLLDIEQKVDLTKVSLIHAHTWFSDGGVAYEIFKKYNIPYIIAVRSTDVNVFYRYFLHERQYGTKILLNSQKIIAISAIYKNRILLLPKLIKIKDFLNNHLMVIPNGVDPYWIENRLKERKKIGSSHTFKLLYIGKFDKGKNVSNLVCAVKELNRVKNRNVLLTLVGGTGNDEDRVLKLIKGDQDFDFIGRIDELEKLQLIFRENDFFVMPSKAETFGLVYIEALLQGLPILYTKNEGIDGFYDDSIGEKVTNNSISEIKQKLEMLISGKKEYSFNVDLFAKNHDWVNIAKVYQKIYTESK